MTRTTYLLLIVTLITSFFFFSCGNNSSNSIRIGILKGPSQVSFLKMMDDDPTIDGKKVKYIIKSEPVQIQALMMQGKLDFAVLPTVMAANLYNKGINYQLVGCPVWGTLYLLTNTGQKDIQKLNNNEIAVFGQGSTADILTRRMIAGEGLKNVRLNYTYTTNEAVGQALMQKNIMYAVVSEPLVSLLMSKDSAITVLSKITCEEFYNNINNNIFVQTAFLVNKRLSDKNPSLVDQVIDAYINSCNYTAEKPDSVAQLMVDYSVMPNTTIARKSLKLCNINYISGFAIDNEIRLYLDIFYKTAPQSIGGKLPDEYFIYRQFE